MEKEYTRKKDQEAKREHSRIPTEAGGAVPGAYTMPRISNIVIKDCMIVYRNLRGEGSPYNRAGCRNFSVLLEDEKIANQLKADGWNVKPYKQKDPDAPPKWHLPVEAKYYNNEGKPVRQPPRIYVLGHSKTELEEADVSQIDFAQIEDHGVSLTIRPYVWEAHGDSGVKAYLKNMYVKVVVDELEEEFRDYGSLPDDDELPFVD